MSKSAKRVVSLLVLACSFAVAQSKPGDPLQQNYDALAQGLLDRARAEVARVRVLVQEGALPRLQLEQAEARLADAEDEAILERTLYGKVRLEEITPAEAQEMVSAAERRVSRAQRTAADQQQLVDKGIVAPAELSKNQSDLESRNRELQLARDRAKLLGDLQQMADAEQHLAKTAQSGATLKNSMIRFDGDGLFSLSDLTMISAQFEKRFHRALPVSAMGQTLVHQSMGLDHRNRVDVALNPDGPEGVWLRQLMERLHIPYLAFRSAVAGAATAPHIHMGPASTRLKR